MRPFSEPHNVALVPLIAPTSKDRIQKIAAIAQGYVYVVSSLGVTGVRSSITTDIDGIVAEVRKATDIPVAVGFGIAAPEQAYKMAKASDGAIVGSAIEKSRGTIRRGFSRACLRIRQEYVRSGCQGSCGGLITKVWAQKNLRSLLHRQQGAEFFGLNYCSGIGSVPPFTASGCSKMKAGDG